MSAVALRLEEPHLMDDPAGGAPPRAGAALLVPDELVDDGPTDLSAAPQLPPVEDDEEGLRTEGGMFAPLGPEAEWSPPELDDEPGWRPDGELAASLRGEPEPSAGPGWRLSEGQGGAAGEAPPAGGGLGQEGGLVAEPLGDGLLSPLSPSGERYSVGSVGGDLEALLLETENLRLRRELHEERRLRVEQEALLGEARARAHAAEGECRDWKGVAGAAEARLRELEWRLAHYQAFAESGLWSRLRGCPPFRPAPLLGE